MLDYSCCFDARFSSMLVVVACGCSTPVELNSPFQRLEEGVLDLARIHPRSGLGLWISQSIGKIRFAIWTVHVSQFHVDQDNM